MTKDALGNRSVYDIENHQTEYYYSTNSSENPDAKYFYDGDGKRIKKKVGSETTVFVYDAGGKLVAEYTIGVTANPSSQTNYITTDTLGSTRLVTNGAGHVIARHDYLPFGDEIYGLGGRTSAQGFVQPDTTRQRFTGYEHDAETGLDFAQARYYGNGFGRFTGVDPTPESAKPSLPESWNRYTYCLNNPLNLTDPNGLDPSSHWGYQQFQGNDGRKWIQFGYWTGEWKDGVFYDRLGQAWQQWSGGNWYVFSDDSAVTLGTNGKCIEFSLVGVEGVSDEMRASLRATQQAAGITTGANFSDVQLEALKTAMIPEYRKTPEHQWNMFLASMAGGTAGSFAPRFSFSFMTASESAVASQPNRIYSSRVLLRSAEESGPYHNFPQSFDQQIFSQGRRTVTTNFYRDARPLVTSDSILYELPGTINKTNGVFQIGVRPSAVGNTELIWHRFFKPIKGFP
jgi:RHS repeat-associated protein